MWYGWRCKNNRFLDVFCYLKNNFFLNKCYTNLVLVFAVTSITHVFKLKNAINLAVVLLTISVRQAGIPASRCVTVQYDRPVYRHWLRSPFKSLLLIIIH